MNQTAASTRSIWLTTLISMLTAAIALVLFVLPAEFGIDPTGAGRAMGIGKMSGYQVSALIEETSAYHHDTAEFPLAPFESVEYKYYLAAGQAMVYSWQAEGEVVYDFHSEEEGTDPEDAVSFSVGRSAAEHGTYVAPYSGIHGWFWENRTQRDLVVRVATSGYFSAATTYSAAGPYTKDTFD